MNSYINSRINAKSKLLSVDFCTFVVKRKRPTPASVNFINNLTSSQSGAIDWRRQAARLDKK